MEFVARAKSQWSINPRLRLGVLVVIGILWLYGLLVASDNTARSRDGHVAVTAEIGRLQPSASDREWPARAERAQQQLIALQAMRWAGNDVGVIEAELQDWLRATATRTGLTLRNVSVVRVDASASSASGVQPGQVIRAKVTADLQRLALVGFLAEVAHHERVIAVERMHLRTRSQPPTVEIELRVVAAVPPNRP